MGMLIKGRWRDEDHVIIEGAYRRPEAAYAAPIAETPAQAIIREPGRFHLIASMSCPWSHRTMLTRTLKGLAAHVPLHIAGGPRTQGYRLGSVSRPWRVPGVDREIEHLHELYALADAAYTGRATVPVLWDAETRRILSNDSVPILRALDAARAPRAPDWTLAPADLIDEIDSLSTTLQNHLSNAVYRAGMALRQSVYAAAVEDVFRTLDLLESRLSERRFLHGRALTETDIRLWPTLARFDAVYHGHFKCSRRRLIDYPHLWGYARDLFAWEGVSDTVDPIAIRAAYYREDREINPSGIVAVAPDIDWRAPHGRARLGPRAIPLRDGRLAELPEPRIEIAAPQSDEGMKGGVGVPGARLGGPRR